MQKLLHIIATPRGAESRTLQISRAFLDRFRTAHPDWVVEELDLFKWELPSLTVKRIDGKYALLSGKDLSRKLRESWEVIVRYIEQFLSGNGYLITAPMWNFSIPYILKHYLDVIVQPKYLFQYTPKGVEGLVKDRKMVIITSRGGDYSSPETCSMDFEEPYLKWIFNFVGITDLTFVHGQPMDALGPQIRNQKLEEAYARAGSLGEKF